MLTKHPDISEDFLAFLLEKLSPEDILSFKISQETQHGQTNSQNAINRVKLPQMSVQSYSE